MASKHILLTENEQGLQNVLMLMLKQAAYQVSTAEGPLEAIEIVNKLAQTTNAIDLFITDMDIVSAEGCKKFIDMLKQAHISTPYLVIAEDAEDAMISQLMAHGCRACISKPFEPTTLMENIESALSGNH